MLLRAIGQIRRQILFIEEPDIHAGIGRIMNKADIS